MHCAECDVPVPGIPVPGKIWFRMGHLPDQLVYPSATSLQELLSEVIMSHCSETKFNPNIPQLTSSLQIIIYMSF